MRRMQSDGPTGWQKPAGYNSGDPFSQTSNDGTVTTDTLLVGSRGIHCRVGDGS